MRTLGIDPGTAIMGWGVVDERGGQLSLVDVGALTTPAPSERGTSGSGWRGL